MRLEVSTTAMCLQISLERSISLHKHSVVLNQLHRTAAERELRVKSLLCESDSDFEDDVKGGAAAIDDDVSGAGGCVITLESRSSSMDDVGSPRALEEALVSLTSDGTLTEALAAVKGMFILSHLGQDMPYLYCRVLEKERLVYRWSFGRPCRHLITHPSDSGPSQDVATGRGAGQGERRAERWRRSTHWR